MRVGGGTVPTSIWRAQHPHPRTSSSFFIERATAKTEAERSGELEIGESMSTERRFGSFKIFLEPPKPWASSKPGEFQGAQHQIPLQQERS